MAIRPKPDFHPIFEVATTREGSRIALINQALQTQDKLEASESYSWLRLVWSSISYLQTPLVVRLPV